MANALTELTTQQLQRAVEIKQQIESLEDELNSMLGGASVVARRGPGRPKLGRPPGKRGMSAAGKAAIRAAQKARWAAIRGEAVGEEAPVTNGRRKKRRMTAEWRAKLALAAKRRWAKRKAAGKNTL